MSIINSFKKALGFSDDYNFDEDIATDDDDFRSENSNQAHVSDHKVEAQDSEGTSASVADASIDTAAVSGQIFDAVIKLLNDIQPEFVRECLNVDAERVYLMNHIDAGVKETMAKIERIARERGEAAISERQRQTEQEINRLRSDFNVLKQEREEFQNARLSASRQKRAMTDRISDLETQVNNLMAEREQYQLENRSMANKLRIANMRGGDGEDMSRLEILMEENTRLETDNKDLKERIASLEQRVVEAESLADSHSADDEERQREMLAEIEQRIAEFEQIKERKNRRIDELQTKLNVASGHCEELNAQLQQHKTESDELRAEIKRLTEMINRAAEPRKERRRKNKNNHAEVTSIPQANEDAQQPASEEKPATIVTISAIDELMDSTDWFTVPEAIPPKKDPEVEEDFGYKEPPKPAPHGDIDKQLSLF